MEMIRFEHVNKSFGAEKVLVDFSLHIEEGEFLTVIGRSGCGKTTMLRMINGLQIPDSGKVLVEGQDVAKADLIALRRRIGYVIQNKGLFPHMTVEENITYVPVISGKKDKQENRKLALRLLQTVGLAQEMLSLQKKLHMTIVFITHDIREAMKLGDRVLVMEKGRIAQIGMPQEIREYPADDFVRELTQW